MATPDLTSAEAQTRSPPPSPPPPTTVTPTVTATLMEDYIVGAPVYRLLRTRVTYVARDGTVNVYKRGVFRLGWLHAVDRPHLSVPPPAKTGWATDRVALPAPVGVYPAGPQPSIVIVPGVQQDTLVLIRGRAIQTTAIGVAGKLGTFSTVISAPNTAADLCAAAARPIAERAHFHPATHIRRRELRRIFRCGDTRNLLNVASVDSGALQLSPGLENAPTLIPLRQQPTDGFVFIGRDSTKKSVLHSPHAAAAIVSPSRPRRKITASQTGSFVVIEDTPGNIEILVVDLPTITSIQGTYGVGLDFSIRFTDVGADVGADGARIAKLRARHEIQASWVPAIRQTGWTELFISSTQPSQTGPDLWVTTRRTGNVPQSGFGSHRSCSPQSSHDRIPAK